MRRIFKILLIIFLVFISHEAQAVSPGGIIKAFKGIGKIFKKGADEVPDIGKKIEDLKGGNIKSSSKIDETILNVDNSSSIKFEEGTLHQIDNLSQDELLEAHNIKKNRRQRDADQLLDVIDSIDVASDIAQTAIIVPFIQTEWQGRVFKSSNYFNNPTISRVFSNIGLEMSSALSDPLRKICIIYASSSKSFFISLFIGSSSEIRISESASFNFLKSDPENCSNVFSIGWLAKVA